MIKEYLKQTGFWKHEGKMILGLFLAILLYTILVNFAGRYMGFRELESVLDSRYHNVLKASDKCLREGKVFFVDGSRNVSGCSPKIDYIVGTWYVTTEKPIFNNETSSLS